ncbi:RagB/SusD family nutrient uptake outer membrane protein [Arachidicoccus ginsenosidivorans]|uniref:RagB/SusD family nutrient uptake outer membrane protein n=1 Tax=Arachidicoccus ginsenosidivorans TaxID=496057 RepID=A0A5B8VPQ1_9BACT|nr:RagB/SusD family nutrient uptake outer membrane protein [Arachidicoccus ginsenosidivorans]QEC73604.1 RagB/SusD family nutrient uptake outer membrane protein [Arachidicoccus ginsenosidivorans]
MRAECLSRAGKVKEAMNDLNTLLLKRWVSGTYKVYNASTTEEALKIILAERRKELLYRGLRWMDLKRFNLEGRNITLTRKVDGKIYELKPNDPFYALPIPSYVVENFGYKQNDY